MVLRKSVATIKMQCRLKQMDFEKWKRIEEVPALQAGTEAHSLDFR
jgi:hypothetical protein